MSPPDAFDEAWQAHQRGDLRTAEEGYRGILRSAPGNGRVWFALGNLCSEQGRGAEAVSCLQQACELLPRDPACRLHLGNALLKVQRYADAEAAYRGVLEAEPAHLDALVNLGYALGEQERFDEAEACYERARSVSPHVPEIHHNLGNILREKGRFEEALASYDEAIRLRPDYVKAHVNRGIALVARGRIPEAAWSLRRAVELQPDFAEAHNSLAHVLSVEGRLDEALHEFERAIDLKPSYPDAHWNRSLLWLLRGDYERGWPAFEWRWRCNRTLPMPPIRQPRWDGSDITGKTILLHAEQGLGDTLHFVRYAPLVKERGARVILQCQGVLIPLLARTPGIDEFIPWGEPNPHCDVWLPLMSLPAVFGTTLKTVPAEVPYLHADPARIEHWKRELAAVEGFRVGIAWQGSPRHPWDRHRSVSLSLFEPLSRVPGVHVVSLQKGQSDEQSAALARPFPLIRFGELVDRGGAFTDTAAIIKNLDLVITIDSAIAHVAGGLGVPVWIVLHRTPDWRWMLDREDSPWYPTAVLFRQKSFGAWEEVFQRVREELGRLVARSRQLPPLLVEISAGELIDKLTILRVKSERVRDPGKLQHVRQEKETLERVRERMEATPGLAELERDLQEVNEQLWEIEDSIREHERRHDFGASFIQLARSVYLTNDRRASLKRQINELLKSRLVEEKSYEEYGEQ